MSNQELHYVVQWLEYQEQHEHREHSQAHQTLACKKEEVYRDEQLNPEDQEQQVGKEDQQKGKEFWYKTKISENREQQD
jgi:hypothetical protein